MRIVVDANVYISGLTVEGLSFEVLQSVFADHKLFITGELIAEIEKAFRKKFKEPENLISEKIRTIEKYSERIRITGKRKGLSTDPGDDHVLEAVEITSAQLLITGDRELLKMKRFAEAEIISPRDYIERYQ